MSKNATATRRPKPKLARARTILTNYVAKNGVLPERKAAMRLLRKRIDVTEAQASNYFNRIRKEVEASEAA
jgi:hypothetical protein